MYDYLLRIMFLGDPSTGKEDLLKHYANGFFLDDLKLTIGVEFYSKDIFYKEKKIKLGIWDFGGEERYQFLLSQYCKCKNGAIIMYDISNSATLDHLSDWISIIRENAGDIPIILVGNQVDMEEHREVSKEDGKNLAKNYNLSAFIEIASKKREDVKKVFELITKLWFELQNCGSNLPLSIK